MKLHEFTSEYEIILCQSPSSGMYWATVYKGGSKTPLLETDDYEEYEDAMTTAMRFVDKEGEAELDEAREVKYGPDDDYEEHDLEADDE